MGCTSSKNPPVEELNRSPFYDVGPNANVVVKKQDESKPMKPIGRKYATGTNETEPSNTDDVETTHSVGAECRGSHKSLSAASDVGPLPVKSNPPRTSMSKSVRSRQKSGDDEDDPFANISDFDSDEDFGSEARDSVDSSLRTLGYFGRDSISVNMMDLEETGALASMAESGQYSYVANKLTEIDHVRQQAFALKDKFDLFFNPVLVRAVLEIVKAKETQIQRAYKAEDLDLPAYIKLMGCLEEVRGIIANRTNTNTKKTTRRVLRRTRTQGSMFESETIRRLNHNSPPSRPKLHLPAFTSVSRRHIKMRQTVSNASGVSDLVNLLKSKPSPSTTPKNHRKVFTIGVPLDRLNSRGNSSANIKSLLNVCISEAFVSMLVEIHRDLIDITKTLGSTHLTQWIQAGWKKLIEADADDFVAQAKYLDDIATSIELYHPHSRAFGDVRSKIRQAMLTVELVELQMNAPKFKEHLEHKSGSYADEPEAIPEQA